MSAVIRDADTGAVLAGVRSVPRGREVLGRFTRSPDGRQRCNVELVSRGRVVERLAWVEHDRRLAAEVAAAGPSFSPPPLDRAVRRGRR